MIFLGLEPAILNSIEIKGLNVTISYTQSGVYEKNILCFTNESNFPDCPDDLILTTTQINYDLKKYLTHGQIYKFQILTIGFDKNDTNETSNSIENKKTGLLKHYFKISV
jgi:hypothetical protein